jgi:hypothetical protein
LWSAGRGRLGKGHQVVAFVPTWLGLATKEVLNHSAGVYLLYDAKHGFKRLCTESRTNLL